ncbi:MAG: hypothetical protein JWM89_1816 [Acidimicrobiales bacterium]|nr:hypothetical protein [Acidimicrobiales bacterium]
MRRTVAKSHTKRCPSGKTRFRDHEAATRALRRTESSNRMVRPARAYECPRCKGWHLTSKAR